MPNPSPRTPAVAVDEPLIVVTTDGTGARDVWTRVSGRYTHPATSVLVTLEELVELRADGVEVTGVTLPPAPVGDRLVVTANGVTDDGWPAALLLDDDEQALVGPGSGPVELSRDAILGGLAMLLGQLQPTDEQCRQVARGVVDPDPARVVRAAHLLAALEAAGEALDVDPEQWRAVTSLPAACWDVTR